MLLENPKKLCNKCFYESQVVNINTNNAISIWDFDPIMYKEEDIENKFFAFLQYIPRESLFSYNSDGFTYAQWQIYWLGIGKESVKKYYGPVMKLFKTFEKILSHEDIHKMLIQGTKEDPLQTTLHHFYEYLETFANETFVRKYCEKYGITLDMKNSEEKTASDMRNEKLIPFRDIKQVNKLHLQYKTIENEFKNVHKSSFPDRCEKCDEILKFFDTIHLVDISEEWKEKLRKSVELRKQSLAIFEKYKNGKIEYRHKYVIELFEKVLK